MPSSPSWNWATSVRDRYLRRAPAFPSPDAPIPSPAPTPVHPARAARRRRAGPGRLLRAGDRRRPHPALRRPPDADQAVARWSELGVESVRILAYWPRIAAQALRTKRPSYFKPSDHTSRGYNWSQIDGAVDRVFRARHEADAHADRARAGVDEREPAPPQRPLQAQAVGVRGLRARRPRRATRAASAATSSGTSRTSTPGSGRSTTAAAAAARRWRRTCTATSSTRPTPRSRRPIRTPRS